MKRVSVGSLFAGAALLGSGCGLVTRVSIGGGDSESKNSVKGSGPVRSDKRSVSGFHRVNVGGPFEVEIKKGPESVNIEAQQNILKLVETSVKDGELSIGVRDNSSFDKPIHVLISVPSLDAVDASGSATISYHDMSAGTFHGEASGGSKLDLSGQASDLFVLATGAATAEVSGFESKMLTVEASGGSQVSLNGSATDTSFTSTGASKIDAVHVHSSNCKAEASGASSVKLAADVKLEADASGASHIEYSGNASVTKQESGASSVDHL